MLFSYYKNVDNLHYVTRVIGSLTGAVTSQNITEVCNNKLPLGNFRVNAMVKLI